MSIDLDHVAIAAPHIEPPIGELVTTMGATYVAGGPASGFRWQQVRLGADGMVVEVIEPFRVEDNDFLVRFLERRGQGPHHLTFKTPAIRDTIARLRDAGIEAVSVNLANPGWQEAFLMPASAGGTVVQLAQQGERRQPRRSEFPSSTAPPRRSEVPSSAGPPRRRGPDGFPAAGGTPATLRKVVLATPELAAPLPLYRDLLEGTVDAEGPGWFEITWPGGSRLRFEESPDRSPGVVHLECEHDAPPAARLISGARFVLHGSGGGRLVS